jgi:hypothetical protein
MRDVGKIIARIERDMNRGLERRPVAPPSGKPKPTPRAWRAPETGFPYPSEQALEPEENRPVGAQLTLTTRGLKVTVVLAAAEVAALPTPDGQRCTLAITCDGKVYSADVAVKSLRKCKATISDNGAENVFCMVQGKLRGTEIIECGLVAQVKQAKEESK